MKRFIKLVISNIHFLSNYALSKLMYCFSPHSTKPTILFLGLTNQCNMSCDFCFQSRWESSNFTKRPKGKMSEQTFKNLINQIDGWITDVNINLFGEPTLHPMLPNWVKILSDKKIHTTIVTNGRNLPEKLINVLCNNQIGHIAFSLEADNFNHKRSGSNFDEVLINIQQIAKARGSHRRPLISVQSLLFPSISRINQQTHVQLLKKTGADYVSWTEVTNWSGKLLHNKPSSTFDTIIKRCDYPWTTIAVDWDGSVTSCCEDFLLVNSLGNINHSNIRELWKSPKMLRLRSAFQNRNASELREFPACIKCSKIYAKTHLGSFTYLKQNILIFLLKLRAYLK